MPRVARTVLLTAVALLLPLSAVQAGDWFNWGRGIRGSGDLTTETRDVRDFDRIRSSGSMDVYVTVGEEPSLQIEFDDNLIDLIETEVHGGTLRIESRKSFNSDNDCKITITVPTLERITASGSGDIAVKRLHGDYFECKLSGSGSITLDGEVNEMEASISGSGDVDARNLKATSAYCHISGSGEIAVFASEDFDGSVSGSGDIFYYGNPTRTNFSVSGSGRIKAR